MNGAVGQLFLPDLVDVQGLAEVKGISEMKLLDVRRQLLKLLDMPLLQEPRSGIGNLAQWQHLGRAREIHSAEHQNQ
jgi:hypothetical protein